MARYGKKPSKRSGRTTSNIYHDYFVGLNYLLRDEPDEAIDTFIKGLEINGDTVETHLALGTLLRRRGKVDKAITVHQDLLTRSGLSSEFGDSVRLELSNDYIAAGLLDRAERLLKELLSEANPSRWDALAQLVTVYQIEKEWGQAIEVVEELLRNSRYRREKSLRSVAAHYCCELAQQALASDDQNKARDHLRKAFQFDRSSARTCMLLAELEKKSGNLEKARKELLRVATSQPHLITEVIPPLRACYESDGDSRQAAEFKKVLSRLLQEQPSSTVLLELARLVKIQESDEAARQTLADGLRAHASLKACLALLQLQLEDSQGEIRQQLELSTSTLQNYLESKPGYRCEQCGFETRKLYWQCPSCQKWDQLNPIKGADGD
jgi:lipopolysaccharide biosynthesis regulator YciM